MKQVLAQGEIRLTRSLGQNFLHDGNQLRRIARAAELTATDRVLEIGPGLGPLTDLLLATAAEVLAIEKDRRLFEFLQCRFVGEARLKLMHDDALDHLRAHGTDWSGWKLVANLPYSVASPILVELAQGATCPARIVVTLQEEVARRLMAESGTADYGVLTLLVQLRYSPQGIFKVPATCFFPAPEVDSACVTLARRTPALLAAELIPAFTRIVKHSFSQRRKMMLKLLKTDWPAEALETAFNRLGLSPQVRAEAVSLAQFVELTRALTFAR
ncbi:MAG: 16S rRNA (adenine(1518)-N(6)/adenine(1519)-N(6))-dimethyltransferase RsmA [Limisphaerales bacterium]